MNNIISSKNTAVSHLIATFPIKREVSVLLKQNTKKLLHILHETQETFWFIVFGHWKLYFLGFCFSL